MCSGRVDCLWCWEGADIKGLTSPLTTRSRTKLSDIRPGLVTYKSRDLETDAEAATLSRIAILLVFVASESLN